MMGMLEDDLDYMLKLDRALEPHENYMDDVFSRAKAEAAKAMLRFPQPNYILTKIAEEAGEVVKAGVHCAEGRDATWSDVEKECIQTIAMLLRLLVEGDEIHGLRSPRAT